MNVWTKSTKVVGSILAVVMGCCFSTPGEEALKEDPYLRFYV